MKRDDDLIREMLLEIEDHTDPIFIFANTSSLDQEGRKKYYHLKLLVDAGYLEESGKFGGSFRMTNAGHDFIDVLRRNDTWEQTKAAAGALGGFTLSMLRDLAVGLIRQKAAEMGIPMG